MQLPTRQSIISLSLLLSAASPAVAAASRSACVRDRAIELAELASCGDKLIVKTCLTNLKPGKAHCNNANVAACYVDAGCTEREAQIEAEWTIKRCDERPESDFGDLRRRQNDDPRPKETPAKATPSEKKEDPKKTTEDPKKAAATTTPAAKPSETPKAASNTPTPNTPVSTSPITATAAFQTDAITSSKSLTCSTPSAWTYNECPTITTGPESGKTLPCTSKTTDIMVCATNMICRPGGCMEMDNTFSPAGIAIAIAFGAALAISVGLTCFFCCRERSQQKKLEKAAEAAAIAKLAAADKKRPSIAVRSVSAGSDAVPLMGAGGAPPPMPHMPQQYGANPFGDGHQMR